jgi:hypothetical protein
MGLGAGTGCIQKAVELTAVRRLVGRLPTDRFQARNQESGHGDFDRTNGRNWADCRLAAFSQKSGEADVRDATLCYGG